MKANQLPTPFFIVYEEKLRDNLRKIQDVATRSGAKIIMAFKANALWRSFPIVAEYCRDCTSSFWAPNVSVATFTATPRHTQTQTSIPSSGTAAI